MNKVFFLFSTFTLILFIIVFSLLSRSARAELLNLNGLVALYNFWGTKVPIANPKTQYLTLPPNLTERELNFFIQIWKEIHQELGACVLIFQTNDLNKSGNCTKEDNVNEICFEPNPRAPICNNLTCQPLRDDQDGGCSYWDISTKTKIQRFDISIRNRLDFSERQKRLIKHEIFHALGFSHYNYGIMHANSELSYRGERIAPPQIRAWRDYMRSVGGFHESDIRCVSLVNQWGRDFSR